MSVNSFRKDEETKESLKIDTLIRLFKYLLSYKKQIVIVLFLMIVTISVSLVNPLITERAVDVYIKNKDKNGLIHLGIFALTINIIFIICVKLRMLIMAKVSNSVLLTIRQELYTHIQKLSFSFFDSRPTGKILARLIGDVNSLKDVLSDSVTTLIPDFIVIIAVASIMIIKNFQLALSAFITLPLLFIGMWSIQLYTHKKWQVFRKKGSNLNAYLHESLSGVRIVQSFTAEEETKETFNELIKEHKNSFIKVIYVADCFSSLIEICWGLGTFFLYFIGIKLLGWGTINVGTLLAFVSYIMMFWGPIRNLSNFYNQLITNLSGAERIFDILDTKPEIEDSKDVTNLPSINGSVSFQDVTFAYDEKNIILDNISFDVKAGESIALVGTTGAGKTTVVNLISRFYDVQGGSILIDGYDISKVSIESLRSQMGVMTQDNFLFSGTIKDNIRYGKLDATEDEIIAAAKAVHAHDFIMKLENGYDTEIKERGARLSIGQRQLLAFARTMVSMPKILILDEATSSIDTHTEKLVQQGIEALLKGRTSFVIAHRLSTIQRADRIFVIDNGGIQEAGTHKELLDLKGAYYELYMAQFKAIS